MKLYKKVGLTTEQRFFSKIEFRGQDECWPWMAHKLKTGYGTFNYNLKKRSVTTAHRIAYIYFHGKIPGPDMEILHSCDNPPCCNPRHLSMGTHKQNLGDAAKRKRFPAGENHYNRKLSDKIVRKIRSLYKSGKTMTCMAKKYDVTIDTISKVILGKTWRHVK